MSRTWKSGLRPGAFVFAPLAFALLWLGPPVAVAQEEEQATFTIYGHAMLDMGYETRQSDPNWFDVMRPTKLPATKDEFGADGRFYSGVRQSRLGVKSSTPTSLGKLNTIFEFELFGVGVDAGQTTFRLRHAYGEIGHFGAGQTWSPFMDIDVFPNSLEYWGPNGMVFFRNVQVRWMPKMGDSRITLALERPGASADQDTFRTAILAEGVQGRFPAPDASAEFRLGKPWGYVEVAGIVRYGRWDDTVKESGVDLSGSATGWGINLSSNVKTGSKGVLRGQVVYGEGIENYMNDATNDIIAVASGNPAKPLKGKMLPVLGVVAFYDHSWNDKWSSTLGGSMVKMSELSNAFPETFELGYYAVVNVLHYPTKNVTVGLEGQYGRRENVKPAVGDRFTSQDFRVQFGAKYNFSYQLGGK